MAKAFKADDFEQELLKAVGDGTQLGPLLVTHKLLELPEVQEHFQRCGIDVDSLRRGLAVEMHAVEAQFKRESSSRTTIGFLSGDKDLLQKHRQQREEDVRFLMDAVRIMAATHNKEVHALDVLLETMSREKPNSYCGIRTFEELDVTPARLFRQLGARHFESPQPDTPQIPPQEVEQVLRFAGEQHVPVHVANTIRQLVEEHQARMGQRGFAANQTQGGIRPAAVAERKNEEPLSR